MVMPVLTPSPVHPFHSLFSCFPSSWTIVEHIRCTLFWRFLSPLLHNQSCFSCSEKENITDMFRDFHCDHDLFGGPWAEVGVGVEGDFMVFFWTCCQLFLPGLQQFLHPFLLWSNHAFSLLWSTLLLQSGISLRFASCWSRTLLLGASNHCCFLAKLRSSSYYV